jgi:hypothetical protein
MTQSWRHQFNLIHDDLEREELRRRISDFEGTIFTRLNELGRVCDSKVEKNEIAEAMQKIRRFQIEKRNYPDFGGC